MLVRLSRVWQAGFRLGHPQVRWSVLRMPHNGGMSAQLHGERAGVSALPLKAMECENIQQAAAAALADAKPMTMNAYRLDLAWGLVVRAFQHVA
ncbi:MAG TPA: hypothetical protein VGC99_04460 [Candidatus Tectomicrobia bacterium]